ncbi:hypothetical protein EQM14_14430 [Caproiciproducens sp. NJN-50]|uniref:putative ABC transporter permease n=1 Tax=Acutalibacteraceae TaxID=3082771 RepID=UPI000FFE3253|nr:MULTISPECIES: putative ABC transporter permease [Acutalibacteraceae]QAT50868.1 hypothetical protein EQM14_14430 [Caproiciproducens sp. NJN-50]
MSDIRTLLLIFALYSFLGWAIESIYCSIPAGKPINRGFLAGPFCPIYGAGAMLVVEVLTPFKENILLLFAAGALLTSLVEYLTGWLLEVLFHTKYWDYSSHRFQIHGRVCLKNSLLFGVMSVAAVHGFQPFLLSLAERIPSRVLSWLSFGLALYFLADTALSVMEVTRLNGMLSELQQVMDEIKERAHTARVETREVLQDMIAARLDGMDENTKARLRALYEQKEKLESGFHLLQRRILRAFPTMRSAKSNESLLRIRELLQNYGKFIRRG